MARRSPSAEPHPADARRAAVLANPAGYTASIRYAGRNNTIPAATLDQAAKWAFGLEEACRQHGASTRANVYALPRDGGGPEVVARAEWQKLLTTAIMQTISRNVAKNSALVLNREGK